ncbi:Vacuolar protein sorting-associated protein VTA1 [Manis javanica]|nr:Vacuolar protein sorting-associated protein VTA1 [Manis javanica]
MKMVLVVYIKSNQLLQFCKSLNDILMLFGELTGGNVKHRKYISVPWMQFLPEHVAQLTCLQHRNRKALSWLFTVRNGAILRESSGNDPPLSSLNVKPDV